MKPNAKITGMMLDKDGIMFYAKIKCDTCRRRRAYCFHAGDVVKPICRNLRCQADMPVRFNDEDAKVILRAAGVR